MRKKLTRMLLVTLWVGSGAVFGAQPANIEEATQLNNRALQLYDQGHYAEAVPLATDALLFFEQASGPKHPNTATVLNNLGGLYRAMGAYDQARPLLERSLAIREEALGPEHPDTANALNSLGGLIRGYGGL